MRMIMPGRGRSGWRLAPARPLAAMFIATAVCFAACGRPTATAGIPSPSPTGTLQQSPAPSPSATQSPSAVACASQTRPVSRLLPAAEYDPTQQQVVIFGGLDGNRQSLGDTWTWKSGCWLQSSPSNSPPARTDAKTSFDAVHGVVVMFGGFSFRPGQLVTRLQDTWTWNGQTWQEASVTGPDLVAPATAYDPNSQRVILFGMTATGQAQTWAWDGTSWLDAKPTSSPDPRDSASMAFDPSLHQILLFGGYGTNHQPLNDTWTWDGTTWTQRHPTTSPAARGYASMAPLPTQHRVLLLGGQSPEGNGTVFADTWMWDGANWSVVTSNHSVGPIWDAVAVNVGEQIVVFGGTDGNVLKTGVSTWDGSDWSTQ
jgi:hypothetical protein